MENEYKLPTYLCEFKELFTYKTMHVKAAIYKTVQICIDAIGIKVEDNISLSKKFLL